MDLAIFVADHHITLNGVGSERGYFNRQLDGFDGRLADIPDEQFLFPNLGAKWRDSVWRGGGGNEVFPCQMCTRIIWPVSIMGKENKNRLKIIQATSRHGTKDKQKVLLCAQLSPFAHAP